jgi:hypothetical protein
MRPPSRICTIGAVAELCSNEARGTLVAQAGREPEPRGQFIMAEGDSSPYND